MAKQGAERTALEKLDLQGQESTHNWFSTLAISQYRTAATKNGIAWHT